MSADLLSSAFATFVGHRRAASTSTSTPCDPPPLLPPSLNGALGMPSMHMIPLSPLTTYRSSTSPHSQASPPYPAALCASYESQSPPPPLKRLRCNFNPSTDAKVSRASVYQHSAVVSPTSVLLTPLSLPSVSESIANISPVPPSNPIAPTSFSPVKPPVNSNLHPQTSTISLPQKRKSASSSLSSSSSSSSSTSLRAAVLSSPLTAPAVTAAGYMMRGGETGRKKERSGKQMNDVSHYKSAKLLRCNHCDCEFGHEQQLKEHKRMHGRPFACATVGCTASFSKANHLSRHVRIVHNKERPFACDEVGCGARFGSKSHLGDHTRAVHMRLRTFKCTMCDASWSKRFNLEKHVRIRHFGEKPFRCSFCRMSFGTRSHVTRHELKVHKKAC